MSSIAQGNCLCGASGYRFSGAVRFALRCYCRDCQQISGGGHLPQIAVPAEDFTEIGKIKSFTKLSDASNAVTLAFCGDCGSPLFKTTSKMPDVRFLCAGSLADDLVADPFQGVFEQGRRSWDHPVTP